MNFVAHLSGNQEVPAVETNATGEAFSQLSKDGMELSALVNKLMGGNAYVNVHTVATSLGEIRGQIK
ncbi:CHRD domain-containing protein [Maribellus maritimus]|uniref:CHRD domain-containing protein n=1 Tax=Maribellus maritimus TaxID=2870838 RepID=UPI001EEC1D5D|nr:CHRD domain-containing protein [Maribellus maritimus]MCG6186400.1 CHRD domain-containing protein [Maribellus maritimus]